MIEENDMKFFERLFSVVWLLLAYVWLLPQLLWGGWKISRLSHPIVTFFGAKRISRDSPYFEQARALAYHLAKCGISIVTGGGPGIMEAANKGAREGNKNVRTMGVAVSGLNVEEPVNPYITDYVKTDYFYLRKHLLIYYSHAFIIFPGGFGTLDELFEVLTLMQTGKLPKMPIVLIGKEYWSHLLEWVARAVQEGTVPAEHAALFKITDDVEEAAKMVDIYCHSKECAMWRHKKIM